MEMHVQFTPLQDFADSELRSEYVAGMTYTVRPFSPTDPERATGEPEDEHAVRVRTNATRKLLAEKVQQWLKDGKVTLATIKPDIARIRGAGEVTDKE